VARGRNTRSEAWLIQVEGTELEGPENSRKGARAAGPHLLGQDKKEVQKSQEEPTLHCFKDTSHRPATCLLGGSSWYSFILSFPNVAGTCFTASFLPLEAPGGRAASS
jgi:hypothetical protein